MANAQQRRVRVHVDKDRFLQQARPLGYHLLNGFLIQHAVISSAFQMRPAKMIVFATIVAATVQRYLRQSDLPVDVLGTSPISRDVIGYISRRSIASATGLPRENVRRIVEELMQDGLLITDSRGRVANKGLLLSRPEIIEGLVKLLFEAGQLIQKLVAAGVVDVEVEAADGTSVEK